MGNSNWRLQTSINFLARQLHQLGRIGEVEVVIVDWGSERPLYKDIELTEEGEKITRYIIVPVEVHERVRGDSSFPDSVVLNVGVRRALGEYVLQLGSDVLLSRKFLLTLFDLIGSSDSGQSKAFSPRKSLMVFPHKEIPYDFVVREPTAEDLEGYIESATEGLPVVPLLKYLWGSSRGILAHRSLWQECRALDEKLLLWGWNDIDLVLRMRLKYSTVDMYREHGLYTFHLAHYQPASDSTVRRLQNPRARRLNPYVFGPFEANDPDWGLGNLQFEEYPEGDNPPMRGDAMMEDIKSVPVRYHKIKHLINLTRFAFSRPFPDNLRYSRSIFSMYLRFIRKGYAQDN